MSWGTSPWGSSPWGTGVSLPPPTLIASAPAIVERRGGTVITILGDNFADPITVDVMKGVVVVAQCYVFDPELDLTRNRLFAGTPALDDGLYDLRVTTDGGDSNIITDALDVRLHAEEFKVEDVRRKWAAAWQTGPRLLSTGGI